MILQKSQPSPLNVVEKHLVYSSNKKNMVNCFWHVMGLGLTTFSMIYFNTKTLFHMNYSTCYRGKTPSSKKQLQRGLLCIHRLSFKSKFATLEI